MGKVKSTLKDFRDFAMKGNVLDLAVGVIIGAAFGKIVSSLVNDVLMPLIGLVLGRVDLTTLKVVLRPGNPALEMTYGVFLQNVLDFLLIALSVYTVIKLVSRFRRKQAVVEAAAPPPAPRNEVLLEEIRDLLKERNAQND